jgi:hypothetical protein
VSSGAKIYVTSTEDGTVRERAQKLFALFFIYEAVTTKSSLKVELLHFWVAERAAVPFFLLW